MWLFKEENSLKNWIIETYQYSLFVKLIEIWLLKQKHIRVTNDMYNLFLMEIEKSKKTKYGSVFKERYKELISQ